MTREADGVPFWQPGAPSGTLFFHQIERAAQFLGVRFEELPAIGDRIHLGSDRQLLKQRLHDEGVVRMPDRTPPQHRHVHRRMMRPNMEVRNIVVSIGGAFDGSRINTILDDEGSKRRAGHDGLAHYHVMPCNWHPIRANSDLDPMYVHRSIVAALHVVFAGPDQFHRSSGKTLRDRGCLTLDV